MLQGTEPGGVWSISPSGFVDPVTGLIDLNTLTGGISHWLHYTLSNENCTTTGSVGFTPLDPLPVFLDPFPAICNQSSPIPLNTTQDGFTGIWSGQGVNMAGNQFDPNGLSGSITLTFTPNPGQCAEANTIDVTIIEETEVIISGLPNMLCSTDEGIDLPVFQSGIQGTWSGPNVINNVFYPTGLSGTVFLQFTPNLGQCGETPPPFEIIINPGPDAFDIGPLTECGDENLTAFFNLSIHNDEITGGSGATVTWFSNIGLTIPISDPSNYSVTGSTLVFAVVTLDGCDSENLVIINLMVLTGIEFEITPNPGILCGRAAY